MVKFRKDSKTKAWKVMGPVSEMHVGQVTATKADGSATKVTVVSLAAPFNIEGVPHVYGELAPKEPRANAGGFTRRGYPRRGQPCGYPGCTGYGHCDECSS